MRIFPHFINKHSPVLAVALIVVVTFAVFSPSLFNGFLNFDDDVHLTANPCLDPKANNTIQDLLACQVNNTYIPLTILSFAAERALFGLEPFVYHLNNLLLHIGVALLVFVFMRQLGLSVWWAVFAALLFSMHPMRVESVAWVTERKDVLYAFFYMAAVCVYGRYLRRIRMGDQKDVGFGVRFKFLIGVMFFGWLSVLSKAMALSLPAVLLLLDWYHGRRINIEVIIEKILVALIVEPVAWQTYMMNARSVELAFPGSLCVWSWCFWFYPVKILVPSESLLVYGAPEPIGFFYLPYIISVPALLGLLIALAVFRKNKVFIFSVLFYFLSIFFLLRMDQAGVDLNFVAPRFAYLPCLGIVFLMAKAMAHIYEKSGRPGFRKMVIAVLCLLIGGYSLFSFQENFVWRSNRAIWERQIQRSHFKGQRQAMLYSKLAAAFLAEAGWFRSMEDKPYGKERNTKFLSSEQRRERVKQAMVFYQRALAEAPSAWDPNYNLGRLYRAFGSKKKAQELIERTFEQRPDFYWGIYELGLLALDEGDPVRALHIWHRAMIISPDDHRLFHDKIVDRITSVIRQGSAPSIYYKAYSDLVDYYKEYYNEDLPPLEDIESAGLNSNQ